MLSRADPLTDARRVDLLEVVLHLPGPVRFEPVRAVEGLCSGIRVVENVIRTKAAVCFRSGVDLSSRRRSEGRQDHDRVAVLERHVLRAVDVGGCTDDIGAWCHVGRADVGLLPIEAEPHGVRVGDLDG